MVPYTDPALAYSADPDQVELVRSTVPLKLNLRSERNVSIFVSRSFLPAPSGVFPPGSSSSSGLVQVPVGNLVPPDGIRRSRMKEPDRMDQEGI